MAVFLYAVKSPESNAGTYGASIRVNGHVTNIMT